MAAPGASRRFRRNQAMTPLAITPGDPGGIGLDLCIQAAIDGDLTGVVIADPDILAARVRHLGLPVHLEMADHFNAERQQGCDLSRPGICSQSKQSARRLRSRQCRLLPGDTQPRARRHRIGAVFWAGHRVL